MRGAISNLVHYNRPEDVAEDLLPMASTAQRVINAAWLVTVQFFEISAVYDATTVVIKTAAEKA